METEGKDVELDDLKIVQYNPMEMEGQLALTEKKEHLGESNSLKEIYLDSS